MKVRRLMTSNVYTCSPDDTLTDAARIMWDKDCGCLPVVDAERRVLAMITDRDICMAAYTQGVPLHALHVSSAMSKGLVTCSPDRSHTEIEQLLRDKQLRRVPVVDGENRLIGIITLGDLAHHARESGLLRALALPAVGRTLAEITERREHSGTNSAAE
jgi:CBS domain-containing protein